VSRVDRLFWALAALGLAYVDAHAIAASYGLWVAIFTLLVAFCARQALGLPRGAQ
jgi:hypothetical protein